MHTTKRAKTKLTAWLALGVTALAAAAAIAMPAPGDQRQRIGLASGPSR